MEKYIEVLPYFITWCLFGIIGSLIFGTSSDKITRIRIIREIFGALWVSAIAYFFLKQFCNWSEEVIYGICSIVSFLNSKIINFLGKDLVEALFKGILSKLKIIFSSEKTENK